MSHNPYTVTFPDGTLLYGVHNGYYALRPLFCTPEEAMDYTRRELYSATEPANASSSEVEVILDKGEAWEEISRASLEARWLTGPANSNERLAEQHIDSDYPFFD